MFQRIVHQVKGIAVIRYKLYWTVYMSSSCATKSTNSVQ